jgi:hypothetical protein
MIKKLRLSPYQDIYTYFSARKAVRETLSYLMEQQDQLDGDSRKCVNEVCNAAIFALGCMIQNQTEWWIRNPLANESTPDVYLMELGLADEGANRIIKEYELEVVTYEEHSEEGIVDFLKRTKLNPKKHYSENSSILCRINRDMTVEDWRHVHRQLLPHMSNINVHFLCRTKLSPTSFKAIWMGNEEALFVEGEDYELLDSLNYDAMDVVKFERRTGLKVETTGYTDLQMFSKAE